MPLPECDTNPVIARHMVSRDCFVTSGAILLSPSLSLSVSLSLSLPTLTCSTSLSLSLYYIYLFYFYISPQYIFLPWLLVYWQPSGLLCDDNFITFIPPFHSLLFLYLTITHYFSTLSHSPLSSNQTYGNGYPEAGGSFSKCIIVPPLATSRYSPIPIILV